MQAKVRGRGADFHATFIRMNAVHFFFGYFWFSHGGGARSN